MTLPDPAPLLDRYALALLAAGGALPAAVPRHARLAAALAAHAASNTERTTPAAARAALLAAAPGLAAHARLLEACAAALPDVLAGRIQGTEVLFPGGSSDLVAPLYRGNAWADHFNTRLARAVRRAAEAAPPGATLRVIEVGAGTGGASEAVLAALDALGTGRVAYSYTDVSPGFLAHGRRHFGAGRPWLEFRRLDLEEEPEAQGIPAGGFDVVVASNVVHATRRIATSLARLCRLLRPGGLLLLNELTRAGAFATMTFGLLDGWWAFDDAAARDPGGPLLSVPRWRAALAEAGFGPPGVVGLGASPEASFQCLLVAAATGAAPGREAARPAAAAPAAPPRAAAPANALGPWVEAQLASLLGAALGLTPEELPRERPFAELGVDSIVAPQLVAAANAALGTSLVPSDVFDHATLADLARHALGTARDAIAARVATPQPTPEAVPEPTPPAAAQDARDIAVIGLSCRFPGAPDADAFWDLLREGRTSIREVPPERWDWRPLHAPKRAPGRLYAHWGGFLEDHDAFDPEVFNLTWREAAAMSPQQRVFLEAAWHALEDAGYGARALSGLSCGVFVGVAHREHGTTEGGESLPALGNSVAILAARISYLLNLRGPSLPIDTACSSSLVAIHLACQSLLSGDAEMAIAGGVSILLTDPRLHLFLSDAGMASPTGACRAFDASADGFVPSEGVGVVVLKPLKRALADGDRVLGVIRASGVNQDGRSSGITAPSGPAQTALERQVWQRAGIAPATIGLVEAHGTGTPLGDPIELRALTEAFRAEGADAVGTTAIGSVKTNIGHALTAAGVAGVIKVLLAFRHATIPPSLHLARPSPQLGLETSPFRIPTAAEPWAAPRRAVVSSFGFSGTNAHLVLDEPPALPATPVEQGRFAFLLSARGEEALAARLVAMRGWIAAHPAASLRDVAFTLAAGRTHFEQRAAIVASDAAELDAGLAALIAGQETPSARRATAATTAAQEAALAKALPGGPSPEEVAALYLAGADGDWGALFPGARRVALPGYPFVRLRFDTEGAAPARETRLIPLDPDAFPLADHRFQGRALLPAAAIMDAACAADGRPPLTLRDLVLHAPLFAAVGAVAELVLQRDARGRRIELRRDGTLHAEATVETGASPRIAAEPPARLAARLGPPREGAALYARFAALGFDYGPALRAITTLHATATEVLARLDLQAAAPPATGPLHPALLDAAMQAAIGLAGDGALPDSVVPMGLDRLEVHAPLPATCFAHLRRQPDAAPGTDRLDIVLMAADGTVHAALHGLTLRVRRSEPTPVHFAVPAARAVAPSGIAAPDLVFATAALDLPGVVAVLPGAGFAQTGPGRFTVNPGSRADLAQLLAALPAPPRAIWHGWDLDGAGAGCEHLAALAALLLAAPLPDGAPRRLLHLHRGTPAQAMTAGLARAVAQESGLLAMSSVQVDAALRGPALAEALKRLPPLPAIALAADGSATTRGFALQPAPPPAAPLGGTWAISGGLGGIARHVARHLVQRHGARVVLLGRTAPDAVRPGQLAAIGDATRVLYLRADIADGAAVANALSAARQSFGPITGVIHAAGVQRDGLLRHATDADIAAVLAVKREGCLALDAATQGDPLRHFVLFSSVSAAFGAPGQAAYGAGNAFLDAFAAARRGPGRSVSIGWPFWTEGGMAAPDGTAAARAAATGIAPLDTAAGLDALDRALAAPGPHVLVLPGNSARIAGFLDGTAAAPAVAPAVGTEDVEDAALRFVTRIFAAVAAMPEARLRADRPFEEMGVDSILVMKLTAQLETELGVALPQTLLFDHRDLRSLAGALARLHPDRLPRAVAPPAPPVVAPAPQPVDKPPVAGDAVAIIGMAGRFPDSDTLEEFWENLRLGRNVIRPVPQDRWNHAALHDPRPGTPGRSYLAEGGFLRRVDRFDPLFFGISPADAARMDPQERLFLEIAWEAMEDAGHTRASLGGARRSGGVFVGVMYGDYAIRAADQHARGNPAAGAAPYWSVANRVSYALDLRGPSLALDTACSSSLTAIHLACRALATGECEVAIAGGVNLSLHPLKFVGLSQGRFAATGGRCRSFAEGGDGYVPSEGVGAVILKPLSRALADGDHIHAVIRGTAVNHGGRTNGYTVPSPARQAEVIRAALDRAGTPPETISCIEAHGTGTALGDPIEVAGLAAAYGDAPGRGAIALGSIKATMGHMEAAAGVAGLIKLVLQLRHRSLVPMPAFDGPNRKIDFAASPLRLQHAAAPWTGPLPLRAGLSSFGAGGANAHLVIEEPPARPALPVAAAPDVIVVSARNAAQLRATSARLAAALATTDAPLAAIAHTLRAGREAMAARLAFVARDVAEAAATLAAFAEGRDVAGLHQGLADADAAPPAPAAGATPDVLARAFAAGATIDWARHMPPWPRRVPLPPHPFLGERHWIEEIAEPIAAGDTASFTAADPIVRDHRVAGRLMVPGAALLQRALDAAPEHAALGGIAWLKTVVVGAEPARVTLRREGEAFTLQDAGGAVLARGRYTDAMQRPPAGPAGPLRRLDHAAIYARLATLGLDYGPALALLDTLETDGTAVRARLLPGAATAPLAALVDAAFQAVIGLADPDAPADLRIPFALDLLRREADPATGREVVVRARGAVADGVFDLALLDAEGRAVVTLAGLATRPAPPAVRLLRPHWQALPTPPAAPAMPLILAGATEAVPLPLAHLPRLAAPGALPAGASRVIWLAPTAATAEPGAAALALIAFLQALDRTTRQVALTVLAQDAGLPEAAALFGVAKCAALEMPWLTVSLVVADAAALADAALATRLAAEPGGVPAREVAFRGAARLQRVLLPAAPADPAPPAGDAWLLVGGTGGIGLALAAHILARDPAACVALVGRSAPDAALAARIAASGGRLRHARADATDAESLRRVLAELRAAWGRPVTIAVQAALVLRDGVLATMDEAAFRAGFAPRAIATLALEQALADEPVPPRALVLFSSANAGPGSPGQANYVAGSSFAEAALRGMRARPWRSLSVAWGLWGEVGAVADAATQSRLARLGVHPILPAEGLDLFDRILAGTEDEVVAVKAEPAALAQLGLATPTADAGALLDAARVAVAEPATLAASLASFAALERWGRLRLRAVLDAMAGEGGLHGAFTPAGLARKLGIAPRQATQFTALLDMLARDGLARDTDGLWRFQPAPDAGPCPADPATTGAATLLAAVLDRYAEVLRGTLDPVEVLFPNGATTLVEGAYAGNPASDHLNALLAEAVAAQAQPGRRLRVIEIGAGTGATAAVVLARLRDAGIGFDYLFTDVSRRFLTGAEARFGATHPGLATALYDAERSVEENGLTPHGFDVVVATNVLHATGSLPGTMARLARLLAPGGLVVVNEVTRRQDFATLVFGLTEGWWRGAAEPGRLPGAPLVDAAGWLALLRDAAGCAATAAHTPGAEAGGGQTLLIGVVPGTAPAQATPPPMPVTAPARGIAVAETAPADAPPRLVAHLRDIFHVVLKLPPEEFRLHQGFDGYGLESLTALDIRNRIAADFPDVPATLLFEQNTLARLARHLATAHPAAAARFVDAAAPAQPADAPAPRAIAATADAPIAIIGFAGRFPGGPDAAGFWRLLETGARAITEIPPDRWDAEAWFDAGGAEGRARTRWAGLIEDVDRFDPLFFGLSPLEAETMDPQERLFLETAWATLEAAGTTPRRLVAQAGGPVGVFAGVMNTPYQWLAAEAWAQGHANAGASAFWSIPNRVSHLMDLGGPSLAVDTACSSSLTAIHLACESIRRGECGAAIAGGVNLILHPRQLVNLSAAGMVSPGAACRTFAEGADGFVDGEGVGAVLLKPLDAALRDGDRIEGVILGSAINSGGRTSGFTVPNPAAQARAIRDALARAGVAADSIGVVETHGTGTALGDPIEIAGLAEGFGAGARGTPLLLGAVKANIGHLESAAGIAGLVKLLLQLRHRRVAPNPHAATPSPMIRFDALPFRLPTEAEPWIAQPGAPRRAGLSSFGAGGANAHLILEEAPALPPTPGAGNVELVPLSATDADRLRALAGRLAAALADTPHDLPSIAHALRVGRVPLAARAVLLVRDLPGLRAGLAALAANGPPPPGVTLLHATAPSAAARMMAETAEGQAMLRGRVAARDLDRLARLWLEGAEIAWDGLSAPGQRPAELPAYPFARERHWLPVAAPRPDAAAPAAAPAEPIGNHLMARAWTEVALPQPGAAGTLLVLARDPLLGAALAAAWPGPTLLAETAEAAVARLADPDATRQPGGLVLADVRDATTEAVAGPADADALADGVALLGAALRSEAADRLRILRLHRRSAAPRDAAMAALLRSAALEAPDGFAAASIAVEGAADPALLGAILRIEGTAATPPAEVLWRDGRRFRATLQPLQIPEAAPAFQPGKAYLLAGGLGEVGRELARHALAQGARIAILGRRAADATGIAPDAADRLAYAACDLTDTAALDRTLGQLRRALSVESFAGVLHLARAVEDGPLATKPEAALRRVLAPKLAGTLALDAALAEEPLEWFALCSSLAAWFGLAGGADYAAACAWQGAFAEARAARVLRGERQGRSVAIAWPQWAYDLHGSDAKRRALAAQGMAALDAAAGASLLARAIAAPGGTADLAAARATSAGVAALRAAFAGPAEDAPLPLGEAIEAELAALTDAELAAYLDHLRGRLGAAPLAVAPRAAPAAIPLPARAPAPRGASDLLAELRSVLAGFLKIPGEKLGPDVEFAAIGLDSIRALQAAERIGRRFGLKLDPTVFFEQPTLGALAAELTRRRDALPHRQLGAGE